MKLKHATIWDHEFNITYDVIVDTEGNFAPFCRVDSEEEALRLCEEFNTNQDTRFVNDVHRSVLNYEFDRREVKS